MSGILGSSLSSIAKPEPWTEQALCASISGDFWYPEDGKYGLEALRICNGRTPEDACPVRAQCLSYALRHRERAGIWGGLSTPDRIRLEKHQGAGVKSCFICRNQFAPASNGQIYCSQDCHRESRRRRAAAKTA